MNVVDDGTYLVKRQDVRVVLANRALPDRRDRIQLAVELVPSAVGEQRAHMITNLGFRGRCKRQAPEPLLNGYGFDIIESIDSSSAVSPQ